MRPFVFENPPLAESLEGQALAEFLGRQLLKISQSLASIDTEGGEVITYGASISGVGNVWDDLNVMDFTGEEFAGVDGCAATALSIKTNAIVTFGHSATAYIWEGPRGVCVGLGGNYAAVATDLVPIGTADHALLTNRDSADQHPQSAIEGRGSHANLEADQISQDGRLSTLESSQAVQDGRLDTLETHPPLTDNPHGVRHDQLPDVGIDPLDPHPQYDRAHVGLLLGGTTNNFTLNTTDSKLVNYSLSAQYNWPDDNDINPVTGEITIPEDGIYQFTAHVLGDQGNDTKEEWIELRIDVVGGPDPGRSRIDILEVATDKTTGRCLQAT